MIESVDQPKPMERKPGRAQIQKYTGEVVYIYAFDLAYEMTRQPVRELLGQPVAQFVVDASKRSPRHLFFYRPQMVRLPLLERLGPRGRSEEHTSELQSRGHLVCRLLLEKKNGRTQARFPARAFISDSTAEHT